jgi:hypothetical protein
VNIGDILKKVGGGIIRNAIPGGGMMLDVVNEFLPEDKKLPAGATGAEAANAISALPPEQRQIVLAKQLDVEIEEVRSWASIQESLAKADASGSSTRPRIAMMMAWIVVALTVAFMAVWSKAVITGDGKTLTVLSSSWELMLTVLGTPAALLRAYFGMRTAEKKARYQAASGQPIVDGLLSLFKR